MTCIYCKELNHLAKCPLRDGDYGIFTDPSLAIYCQDDFNKLNLQMGEYGILYAGMGCSTYIRRNLDAKLEYFFLHSDSYGQYGLETSDMPKVNAFLYGYKFKNGN